MNRLTNGRTDNTPSSNARLPSPHLTHGHVAPRALSGKDLFPRFHGNERRSHEWRQRLSRLGQERRWAEDERRDAAAPIVQHHVFVYQIRDDERQQLARAFREDTIASQIRAQHPKMGEQIP